PNLKHEERNSVAGTHSFHRHHANRQEKQRDRRLLSQSLSADLRKAHKNDSGKRLKRGNVSPSCLLTPGPLKRFLTRSPRTPLTWVWRLPVGTRFFAATVMARRLYPEGIGERGPWDNQQLVYWPEEAMRIALRQGVDRL